MKAKEYSYRLIILGAGFSKFAGLPLGNELFELILKESKDLGLYHILEQDIRNYLTYKSITLGKNKNKIRINLEDLISYLDIEHYLRLKGSDTWSDEGNKSQILIRNLICK